MVFLAALVAFGSIDEAAMAALTESAQLSRRHNWEYGGFVWEHDGRYSYTYPVTSGEQHSVDLAPALPIGHIVASYHTHPCVGTFKILNNYFSTIDTISDRGLGVTGYIWSGCDHYVHRWALSDDEGDLEVDFHSGTVTYLTIGHIVGMIN